MTNHSSCFQVSADLTISSLPWPAIRAKLHKKIWAKELCWDHAWELQQKYQKPDLYQEGLKEFSNLNHP